MENKGAIFSGEIIARLLNITPRRLQQLAKEGVVPRAGRGQYPLAGVIRGYIQYIQNGSHLPQDLDPERMDPFKRRAFYQGEQEKNRLLTQAGELVTRAQYEDEISRAVKILAHCLETLPDRLERDAGATGAQLSIIEEHVDQARLDLFEALGKKAEPATEEVAS